MLSLMPEMNNQTDGTNKGCLLKSTTMKTTLVLICSLVLPQISFARLGETLDQCEARYGRKTGELVAVAGVDSATEKVFTFIKDHINIAVVFRDDVSIREVFTAQPGDSLSESRVEDLLNANADGSTWKMTVESVASGWRKYERTDGKALAAYEWENTSFGRRGKSLNIRAWKDVAKKASESGF